MAADDDPGMVVLFVRVPRLWKERMANLAKERAISLSDVARVFIRDALYGRKDT